MRTLIREVNVNRDDQRNEVTLSIHWAGGRHTVVRMAPIRDVRHPAERRPKVVDSDPPPRRRTAS